MTPAASALRNLDLAGKPLEPKRFRNPVAAMMQAIVPARGYQCDGCADRAEGHGYADYE